MTACHRVTWSPCETRTRVEVEKRNDDGEGDAESVWRFAHGAGAVLVERHPHILTQEFIKADRGDRIFVGTGRNLPGATFAAVYAVRARPGAPSPAPCRWAEIEGGTVGTDAGW